MSNIKYTGIYEFGDLVVITGFENLDFAARARRPLRDYPEYLWIIQDGEVFKFDNMEVSFVGVDRRGDMYISFQEPWVVGEFQIVSSGLRIHFETGVEYYLYEGNK